MCEYVYIYIERERDHISMHYKMLTLYTGWTNFPCSRGAGGTVATALHPIIIIIIIIIIIMIIIIIIQ